jgi:hypothetical protein
MGIDGISVEETEALVLKYSDILGDVKPSKDLAREEWGGRNGLVLALEGEQSLHRRLCREVGGIV